MVPISEGHVSAEPCKGQAHQAHAGAEFQAPQPCRVKGTAFSPEVCADQWG